ncbi:MAG: hypothetical protein HYY58_01640 [Candidatus Omnitrophica bacterium]|nr:hypothetical protein [Candidatus Omnitrophota bacterium]
MKQPVGSALGLLLVLAWEPASVEAMRIHDMAESDSYREKTVGMVGRGLLNMTTGYVDVFTRLVDESMAGPLVLGTLRGLAVGTGCAVLRTLSGAVDWATFWVPGFNGAPVSPSYHECLG